MTSSNSRTRRSLTGTGFAGFGSIGILRISSIGLERRFGLAIDVDDVPELLQRAEDEERVDEQREELSDRDLLVEDQVEHEEQDRRAHEVDARALDEAQAADVADLLELELEDLVGRRVEPQRLPARTSPRLFTSSMLRSDSVVAPASAVVSATMTF